METAKKNKKLLIIVACIVAVAAIIVAAVLITNNNNGNKLEGTTVNAEEQAKVEKIVKDFGAQTASDTIKKLESGAELNIKEALFAGKCYGELGEGWLVDAKIIIPRLVDSDSLEPYIITKSSAASDSGNYNDTGLYIDNRNTQNEANKIDIKVTDYDSSLSLPMTFIKIDSTVPANEIFNPDLIKNNADIANSIEASLSLGAEGKAVLKLTITDLHGFSGNATITISPVKSNFDHWTFNGNVLTSTPETVKFSDVNHLVAYYK